MPLWRQRLPGVICWSRPGNRREPKNKYARTSPATMDLRRRSLEKTVHPGDLQHLQLEILVARTQSTVVSSHIGSLAALLHIFSESLKTAHRVDHSVSLPKRWRGSSWAQQGRRFDVKGSPRKATIGLPKNGAPGAPILQTSSQNACPPMTAVIATRQMVRTWGRFS